MNSRIIPKITLSLLLVTLVLVSGILLSAAGDRSRSLEGQPGSRLATVEENVLAALAVPAVEAASYTFNLCASDGTIALPGGVSVDVWGFVDTGGGSCTAGLVNSLPGPELRVNAGDDVTIHLSNSLAETVSILISGQDLSASGGVAGPFASEAAANGGTVTYTFVAEAGTYLYESGSHASIQIPMGLYGGLIVDAAPGQAYAGLESAYDVEATLLLSEIDLSLNANPAGFDLLNYHPTYWLINGESYDGTGSPIAAMNGERVLLRYLNAGFDHPSMALLGAYQTVIAKDGFELANDYDAVAEIIPAGTTVDTIVDTAGLSGILPLYNRNMYVTNGDSFPGGMLTFLDIQVPVGNPPTADLTSPAQASTVFGDAVLVQIDASDIEDAAGSLTVEWAVDGGSWLAASWTGAAYEATWDTTASADGAHTIHTRATDSDGNVAAASNEAIVSNLPAVSVVAPTDGATVFGDALAIQIEGSDAEDAAGTLAVSWDVNGGTAATAAYNAGSGYYEAILDTTVLSDGAYTINAAAADSRGFSAGNSNSVTVSNQPTVSIVAPADGTTVAGLVQIEIDAGDAEDGAGSLIAMWDIDGGSPAPATYNAGTGYHEATWDTATAATGPHTINVSANDSRSNTATDSSNVTVGANSIHVGDLDGSSAPAGGANWTATVVATVHAIDESPVVGATVTIESTRTRKSNGSAVMATLTCVTNASGQCNVTQAVNSGQFEDTVSFTVTNVTNAAPYQAADNHDPDGDSDGTTIAVPR